MDALPLEILVVDDRSDCADSLALLLRTAGHHVEVHYDGEAACQAASVKRFDAIFLDIAMPKFDGFRAAERIRRNSACRDCLLVAVTGYADPVHRKRSHLVGFDHYLVKPVDPSMTLGLIDQLNDQRRPLESHDLSAERLERSGRRLD